MRLKTAFFAVLCAASVFLTGCGDKTVYQNGIADIKNANISISIPENWTVVTDDKVYDELYKGLSDEFSSAKELKKSFEDNGERLLLNAQSPDGNVVALFSETEKGESGAAEILRAVHDTTVFDLRSSGFYTESSFEEYTWGGASGVMSVIKVSEKDGAPAFMEEREFCFERDDMIFSLQIHITGGFEYEADSIEISAAV